MRRLLSRLLRWWNTECQECGIPLMKICRTVCPDDAPGLRIAEFYHWCPNCEDER